MPKPSQLPRWASGAGAAITPEPLETKKDVGWVVGEKPPAQSFNWFMRRVYEWCVYLDGITNEALTWAMKQAFQAGASSPVAPAAADDLVNKTYADARETAAKTYGDGLIAALKAAVNTWTGRQTFTGGATMPTPVNPTDAATKAYVDAPLPALVWNNLALNVNWVASGPYPQYSKDRNGVVRLRGGVTSNIAGLTYLGIIVGASPQAEAMFAIATQGSSPRTVGVTVSGGPNGDVTLSVLSVVGETYRLDGIQFMAG